MNIKTVAPRRYLFQENYTQGFQKLPWSTQNPPGAPKFFFRSIMHVPNHRIKSPNIFLEKSLFPSIRNVIQNIQTCYHFKNCILKKTAMNLINIFKKLTIYCLHTFMINSSYPIIFHHPIYCGENWRALAEVVGLFFWLSSS